MKTVAIIPARGGSKRIPKKNIKLFHGKPIIAFSIEIALKSNLFDEVIVSTDDPEIAKIAIFYGAKVPFFRSEKNSDDFATTLDVIGEVLQYYDKLNISFDLACCIYATAPFITANNLILGYDKISSFKYDVVYPVVEFSYPIWRGLTLDSEGRSKMIWVKNDSKRSQDLEKVYHDAGQWYWINCKKSITSLLDSNSASIIVNEMETQDIDNEIDWKMAEIKFKLKK